MRRAVSVRGLRLCLSGRPVPTYPGKRRHQRQQAQDHDHGRLGGQIGEKR